MTDFDPNAPAPTIPEPNTGSPLPTPDAPDTPDQTPPPAAEQPVDASGASQTPVADIEPAPSVSENPPVSSIQQQVADQRDHITQTEHFRIIFDPITGVYTVIRADWIGDDGVSFHQDYLVEFQAAVAGI